MKLKKPKSIHRERTPPIAPDVPPDVIVEFLESRIGQHAIQHWPRFDRAGFLRILHDMPAHAIRVGPKLYRLHGVGLLISRNSNIKCGYHINVVAAR